MTRPDRVALAKILHPDLDLSGLQRCRRLLFEGPVGVGKTTLARALAELATGGSAPDLIEISCGAQGVDAIRDLLERHRFAPWGGKNRAVILDEVNTLPERACSALLTTLDDDPSLWIGTTNNAGMVHAPLRSRLSPIIRLGPPSVENTAKFLQALGREPETAKVAADSCHGDLRLALAPVVERILDLPSPDNVERFLLTTSVNPTDTLIRLLERERGNPARHASLANVNLSGPPRLVAHRILAAWRQGRAAQ